MKIKLKMIIALCSMIVMFIGIIQKPAFAETLKPTKNNEIIVLNPKDSTFYKQMINQLPNGDII